MVRVISSMATMMADRIFFMILISLKCIHLPVFSGFRK